MIMATKSPNAIAIENIKAFTPRTIPFKILPSIKSVNELINGTPGIKNRTDVAKACSKLIFKPALIKAPANSDATNEPKKTQKYGLNFLLMASCLTNNPQKVAPKAMNISGSFPPNEKQNPAPARLTKSKIMILG